MEAASKAMQELQEQLAATKQAADDDASKAAEAHALELQKMQVERTKLEVSWPPAAALILYGMHMVALLHLDTCRCMQQWLHYVLSPVHLTTTTCQSCPASCYFC
jgi:hypothetical protein